MPPIRRKQPRPALQTRFAPAPHPSGGRGFAYSQDMRQLVIHLNTAGHNNNPIITQARSQHVMPSHSSLIRWIRLIQANGRCRPCRRTGNKRAKILHDHNIVFPALYRIVFPKSSATQINAFLFRVNYGSALFRFYTDSQIHDADIRIGMTRKCGSTTAYQAYLPVNKHNR